MHALFDTLNLLFNELGAPAPMAGDTWDTCLPHAQEALARARCMAKVVDAAREAVFDWDPMFAPSHKLEDALGALEKLDIEWSRT